MHGTSVCRQLTSSSMQNLKEGMTTVIEKLMAENVELTQRFNEAVRPLLHAAVAAVCARACPLTSAQTACPHASG